MRSHKKANLLIGTMVYAIALTTMYVPLLVRQMWKVDGAIWSEANSQLPPKSLSRGPDPPDFANELSPASIMISLVPQNGFSFDLGGAYKLDDKRQYLLVLENSGHIVSSIDMEINVPYPVEAHKIVKVSGIREFTFQPTRPLINLLGAKLENNGCLGRWRYDIYVRSAQGRSRAEVSLILNSYGASHPQPGIRIQSNNGFVAGFFIYNFRGETIKRNYYADLRPSQDATVNMSEPESQIPVGLKKPAGFMVLDGPCIPDSSLIAP